jgi:subtilisin family serine protease
MVKNFTSLLALILAFYSFNTYAQSQQFGLVHSSVLNSPIGSISLKSYGFYSPDSVYVGAIYTNKSLLIQPLTTAQKIYSLWKNEDSNSQTVTVYCFESSHLTELSQWIAKNQSEPIFTVRKSFNAITIQTTNETILEIAKLYYVKRIIYQSPTVQNFNFLERTNHRINSFAPTFPLNDTNALTGKNIIIGEWDGGNVGNHIDLNSRVKIIKAPSYSSHATHVAGTMSGAGNLNPLYRGMAPESFVYSWDFMGDIPV